MKYIELTFIPGAGGNFLSRALSLNNHVYAFIKDKELIQTDIVQKLRTVQYTNDIKNWLKFENELTQVTESFTVEDLERNISNNSVLINMCHSDDESRMWPGCDDEVYRFKIIADSNNAMQWLQTNHIKNQLKKEAFVIKQMEKYSTFQKSIQNDKTYHEVSLNNIIDNVDTYISEIDKICDLVGIPKSDRQYNAIKTLYSNWKEASTSFHKNRKKR